MLQLAILVISVIGNLLLGILTFYGNKKSKTNQLFILLLVVTDLWLIINHLAVNAADTDTALFLIRPVMFFAAAQVYVLFILVHTFPSTHINLKRSRMIFFTLFTLFVMADALSPYLFVGIRSLDPTPSPIPGPGIGFFAIQALGFLVSTIYMLIKKTRQSRGVLKQQLFYLSIGIISTFTLIALSNFILVVIFSNTYLLVLTPAYTLILAGCIAYAIIAHQLFDIRVIIKRTVVYSGLLLFTLATYSMIVFFFTAVFGGEATFNAKSFIANLIAAMLIAFGISPLQKWLTATTDKYLFKGEYDPQAVLSELSKQLSASVDIRQALQSMVLLIKSQLRLSRSAVITFKNEESKVVIKDAIQDGYADPAILMLPPENLLLQQFARAPQVIITDMLRRECEVRPEADPHKQACQMLLVDLEKLGVAMAIPILVDEKAIGMFIVGEKLSGDAYTKNEIEFLTIVAHQTANTIEKARFWEEDQMKSEFVSIASHELLTPTAAIKGYLSMILDENMGQVDDTARRYLTKVYSSSDRLAHLVEDLLNVSRIEGGRLKINKRAFSLAESVQKAVEELSVNAKKKALDLAFVAAPGPLPQSYADPDHIYRVLVNLIGNSIKYTNQGWVRCFVTQYDAEHLLFAVSDSGLGIPKESISHLFEKFYRADRKEIAGIQGTGLGLYISKKIIDLMGGQMWVQSEVGKGTTFFFTVPVFANQPTVSTDSGQIAQASNSAPAPASPSVSPPATPSAPAATPAAQPAAAAVGASPAPSSS